jgi:hypothetical protein
LRPGSTSSSTRCPAILKRRRDHAARLEAGRQTELLVRKLNALQDGATIVMIRAAQSLSLPAGPYERVSMFAHVLKQKAHTKSRIIVLDPKANFSKQALFLEGWEKHYPGMIEWQDPKMHGGIKGVDPATARSGRIWRTTRPSSPTSFRRRWRERSRATRRSDQSGFCPIDPENMKSKMDPNIFVVGDACIPGDMPKSAFSANSQAKVAAMIIGGELANARTFPARYPTPAGA